MVWTYQVYARENQPLFAPNTISCSSLAENRDWRRHLVIDLYEDGKYSGWTAVLDIPPPAYQHTAQLADLFFADYVGDYVCMLLNSAHADLVTGGGRWFTLTIPHVRINDGA